MRRPVTIGIAGGTGSGKTTVVSEIYRNLSGEGIALIEQDAYYKDQPDIPLEERKLVNYDHPLAFDNDLLIGHLEELFSGRAVKKPVYSFETYTRTERTVLVEPKGIIILEGILLLEDPRLRSLLDIKIYVDTDPDVRFIRRLQRDLVERGRTLESVIKQYLNVVRPMHLMFVEPSKRYADIIIPEGGFNRVAIDLILAKIKAILTEREG
ncbi:MAG: uridine kinase [Firmicutes bacterium]|nr:uridine kinase [Bacillota bacterium]MCL5040355.1 uridine kinase [Bacillota bacterium]